MNNSEYPLVVTVIVHYNTPGECADLVNDLQKITCPNHEIVIVDNQSEPDRFRQLKDSVNHASVRIVQNSANLGYGSGINCGAECAKHLKPAFLHIINCDTRILNNGYVKQIVDEFSKREAAGLIGPGILTDGNRVQNTVMPFVSLWNALRFRHTCKQQSVIEPAPVLYPSEVINGVCFVVRADIFYRIGGFDDDFFMYGEEHDFCYRLKKNGYQSFFWSGQSIYHDNGNVPAKKAFTWRDSLIRCNQVLFLMKHKTKAEAYLLALLFICSLAIKKMSGTKFPDIKFGTVIRSMLHPKEINSKSE